MKRVSQSLLVAGLVASIAACNEDDGRPTYRSFEASLLDLMQADPDLSTFVELAEVAGIDGGLAGNGTVLTVFAPTNAAFSALDSATLQMLRDNPEQLSAVLRYHVIGGNFPASLLASTSTGANALTMATGQTMGLTGSAGNLTLQGGQMTSAQLVATDAYAVNGVLHKIGAVLLPPPAPVTPMPMSILETASSAGLTSLGMALTATLTNALMGEGPFTVFAPSDAAFMALGDLSMVAPGIIENVLATHVVPGDVPASAVLTAAALPTLAKTEIEVDASMTPPTVGGARLDPANLNIEATNGRVHVLQDVIIPPTIVEVAASTPSLSTLVQAVGNAGLGMALTPDTLGGATPITVFAPTNQAFQNAMIDPAMVGTSTLAAVLQHHVVSGQALSRTLTDGQMVMTLNGTITVNVAGDGSITVTDGSGNVRNVITADVRTRNGVVHVIDGVLVPMN